MTGTPRIPHPDIEQALGSPATFLGGGSFGDAWLINGQVEKVLCGTPVDADRLDRETTALSRVRHPRVVRLHRVRTMTIGSSSHRVMTFDYVTGGDAAGALAAGQIAHPDDARELLSGLLEAADALHCAHVLHRDIKPANILLRDGRWTDPVLCDLGLARLDDASSITTYPAAVGTARYMAPEQLGGQRAQKGSDLFSIGVVVREAITGQHPFFDPNQPVDIAVIARGPRPLPAGTEPSVAMVLDSLVAARRHLRGSARSNLRRLRQGLP